MDSLDLHKKWMHLKPNTSNKEILKQWIDAYIQDIIKLHNNRRKYESYGVE